jgi:hypothetical protein
MRNHAGSLLGLAIFASIASCLTFALAEISACSNNGSAGDASYGPNQPLGAPCDSTLTSPCAAAATSCSVNSCTDGVCSQFLVDASAACAPGDAAFPVPPINSLCTKSSDCDAGEQCGYLAGGGCGVTGVCVAPATISVPAACGCTGLPDPYIAPGFTSAPAASPGACDDSGADAGEDAGSDASEAADANDAASARDAADASDGAPE